MGQDMKLVTVYLDKERHLHFDLNALEAVEELTGKTLDSLTEHLSMKVLKALMYAGLMHEDADLTPEKVGKLITFDKIAHVSEALGKALGGLK